jgi:hypothetical protein
MCNGVMNSELLTAGQTTKSDVAVESDLAVVLSIT